ncbi:MAG: DUF86 domain-containing protein [Desulfobacterales bacterium]|nr:DUF86 domain-containing protein [Desulfobacterales bacterium]
MNERDRLFLQHMLAAIDDIGLFTTGGKAEFLADRKTQSAVVRQIEIIGEAVKNLDTALTTSEPGVPWRQIAGTRDRLIHAYFSVNLDAVWAMVEQDLPTLRLHLQRILREHDPAP